MCAFVRVCVAAAPSEAEPQTRGPRCASGHLVFLMSSPLSGEEEGHICTTKWIPLSNKAHMVYEFELKALLMFNKSFSIAASLHLVKHYKMFGIELLKIKATFSVKYNSKIP